MMNSLESKIVFAKKAFGKKSRVFPLKKSNSMFKVFLPNGKKRVCWIWFDKKKVLRAKAFQQFAFENHLPVPKIFSLKKSPDFCLLEFEFVEGTPVTAQWAKMSEPERIFLIEQIAEILAKLHSVKPNYKAKKTDLEWKDRTQSWGSFVRKNIEINLQIAVKNGIVKESFAKKILFFVYNTPLPEKVNPCICHGDLWLENILVNKSRKINAVIDWKNAFLGHCLFDVAITENALKAVKPDLSKHFLKTYAEMGGKIGENYAFEKKTYLLFKFCQFLSLASAGKKQAKDIKKMVKEIKKMMKER
ncbi:MAG: aminoglycoside phosphotransferase family protein [Candidatus Diapherotrites archaeon]